MSGADDVEDDYDEFEQDDIDEHDHVASAPPGDAAPRLYYPTVEAFVTSWLAPTYRRHLSQRTRLWCPQWWCHGEAIVRLEALWRAWEHLRTEPALGMSVWLRDHADHHMAVLFDVEGPFRGCRLDSGHSEDLEPLPLHEAPAGLFASPAPC